MPSAGILLLPGSPITEFADDWLSAIFRCRRYATKIMQQFVSNEILYKLPGVEKVKGEGKANHCLSDRSRRGRNTIENELKWWGIKVFVSPPSKSWIKSPVGAFRDRAESINASMLLNSQQKRPQILRFRPFSAKPVKNVTLHVFSH